MMHGEISFLTVGSLCFLVCLSYSYRKSKELEITLKELFISIKKWDIWPKPRRNQTNFINSWDLNL